MLLSLSSDSVLKIMQPALLLFYGKCMKLTFMLWRSASIRVVVIRMGGRPKHSNSKKSKAVPLHAMMALGGIGDIARTHSRPLALDGGEWAVACPGRALSGDRTPGTHCTGGWVDLRAGLDTEVRGKVLCPCRGSNPDRPVVQSVVRHYTD
jgi:hypothetical protein